MKSESNTSLFKHRLVLRVIIIGLFITLTGFILILFRISGLRSEKEDEIKAISDLKIVQLVQWQNERLSEAEFFSRNNLVQSSVDRKGKGATFDYSNELRILFSPFLDSWRYANVNIFAADGSAIFSLNPDSQLVDHAMKERILRVIEGGQVSVYGFFYCQIHKEVHFDIAAPIRSHDGDINGVLLFRIDPDEYLLPLIKTWPTSSRTSEVLLVQRTSDSIEFITGGQRLKNEALELKISMNNIDLPAVKVVNGYKGIYYGRDHLGNKVLTYLSPVTGTPWFLIAKVATAELFSELYIEAFMFFVIIILLISLNGAMHSFIYNKKQGLVYKSLWETEAKYQAFFENSMDAIFLTTPDGNILSANPAACELFGYSEEEIIKTGRSGLIDETDPRLPLLIRERAQNGKAKGELYFVRKDGTHFHAELTSAVFGDAKGEKKTSMIIRDMTERKNTEAQINLINDRLNQLIHIIEELASVRSINDIEAVIKQYSRKLINCEGFTFVIKDGEDCIFSDEDSIEPLWKGQKISMEACASGWAMLNKQTIIVEDVFNDARFPSEMFRNTFIKSLVIVPVGAGPPIGALGFYWASKHQPLEIEVRLLESLADATAIAFENVRLYNDLEALVNERTIQLTAANKELEAFSYSVSHDLRAPLRAIDGFTKILTDEYGKRMTGEEKRVCTIIRENTQKMGQLIDDLLAFSKLGKKEPKKSVVDMRSMVNAVCQNMCNDDTRDRLKIEIKDIPDGYGDPGLLQLVWTNLISNAVKFSSKTDTPIIIIAGELTKQTTVYSVKDNGAGFDMTYKDRLFGVFQRLHKLSDFDGTGVGLALVHRIITRHGGEVWAEGEVGKGATFWFSLPKV